MFRFSSQNVWDPRIPPFRCFYQMFQKSLASEKTKILMMPKLSLENPLWVHPHWGTLTNMCWWKQKLLHRYWDYWSPQYILGEIIPKTFSIMAHPCLTLQFFQICKWLSNMDGWDCIDSVKQRIQLSQRGLHRTIASKSLKSTTCVHIIVIWLLI